MARSESLGALRDALAAIGDPPAWSDWNNIEAWAAGARPFIGQAFPAEAARFEMLAAEPRWIQLAHHTTSFHDGDGEARARARVEKLENARIVSLKKSLLLDFLDGLARRSDTEPPAKRA